MNTNLGIRVPHVTSLPGANEVRPGRDANQAKPDGVSEFEAALKAVSNTPDLQQIKEPLKFSAHAMQRLNERNIKLDPGTMTKVNEALDRAAAKGLDDTLVLTADAAFIVNMKNRTVITAMDRGSLNGNVFTNIDGAVIV